MAPSSAIGMAYLMINDEVNGVKWLERAYAERDSQLMHIRTIPLLKRLWSHPKLLEIYRRMGLNSEGD